MASFAQRARLAAAYARASLRAFSTAPPPRFPGVGLQEPTLPPTNRATEARVSGRDALEGRISYGAGPMLDRYSTYSATALDPLKIESILRQADLGIVYRYCDMAHQVLQRDAHLFGVDRGRRQSVANKPFLIPPKNDTPLAKALAHFMREVIDGIDGFPTSVYQLLSANCVGYSACELVWAPGVVRFPGLDGRLIRVRGLFPRRLDWVHGKHFQFKADSDEPLLDLGTDGAIHLPRHKFVFHRAPGDNIVATRGYIRSVVWLHFLKHCGLRDLGVFLHLYGIPQLYGKIERGLWNDQKMRRVLELALIAYGTGQNAPVLPDGLDIEAKPGPIGSGAADGHQSMIGLCNYEISKAVQGETLTTEPGESGAYNLGVVHADSKHEVTAGDALTAAADLRADVFVSAVELNAYELARALNTDPEELLYTVPPCEFRTDRETSPKERAELMRGFADSGLPISISQLRREHGLDKPTGPDDVLPGKPITVSAGGAVAGSTDASTGLVNAKQDEPARAANPPPEPPDDNRTK
jgi:phage gp29-like protein